MVVDYQVVDVFDTDPTKKGWAQFAGASFAWDTVDKVGGQLGQDVNARYIKYLGKVLTQADQIIASFTFMVENIGISSANGLMGFFNVDETEGIDECVAMLIDNSTGTSRPHIYVAYDDGTTKITGADTYNLVQGTKYVAVIRYVPEDGRAYLQLYDFLTEQLLFEEVVTINTAKTFELNQVGMSETATGTLNVEAWMYDMNAVGDPDPIVYTTLYAKPDEIRDMTNLDAVKGMTDNTLSRIETVYAIPQVNSRFRAEGYAAPFSAGDNTPPLVRTISALLTAAYAARASYTGHSPNESPLYASSLKEVNELWKSIMNGELELIDIGGSIIERTLGTSTDMLSTTEGQITLFTLNDVPDITEVMSGRLYVGRAGNSYRD